MILLNIEGAARPVRTEPRSSRATDRALSIRSSASSRVSSITGLSLLRRRLGGPPLLFVLRCAVAPAQAGVLISVPILSPATARAMFPSCSRLNTTIGIRFSMERLIAVASATLSSSARTVA